MSQLDEAVKEAMRLIRGDKVLARIKKEGRDVQRQAKEEAKKANLTLDEYNDRYPNEWGAYFEFNSEGELTSVVFDGAQYYPGHGNKPLAVISCHPSVTLGEIEREVEDALSQAEIFSED